MSLIGQAYSASHAEYIMSGLGGGPVTAAERELWAAKDVVRAAINADPAAAEAALRRAVNPAEAAYVLAYYGNRTPTPDQIAYWGADPAARSIAFYVDLNYRTPTARAVLRELGLDI
jgi:hypothetical protein